MIEKTVERGTWAFKDIPSTWSWASFGDVFDNVTDNERKLQQGDYKPQGPHPVIDQGNTLIGGFTSRGDLLQQSVPPFIVFGDHTRCVKYVSFPFVQGADGVKVLTVPRLNPKFCYWALQAIRLPDRGYSRHYQFLRNSFFPVAPLNEQRRIVGKMEELFSDLDAGVATLARAKANLTRYRAAVLKAAVEGKLTAEWRKKHPGVESASRLLGRVLGERSKKWEEAEKAKLAAAGKIQPKNWRNGCPEVDQMSSPELPVLPATWCWSRIEQLARDEGTAIGAGPFGTIFKAKDFRLQGVPIIFLRHVAPGRYLTHKPGFMDRAKWDALFREYSVFGGELLITKLGEPPGACAIYPEGIGPAMVTPDVIRMSVNRDLVRESYLMNYLNSMVARRFTSEAAFGSTRLRLTLPLFRDLPVPLPPLNEQDSIVEEIEGRLSTISQLASVCEGNILRARSVRQSILRHAFEGKLGAQDPKDEPATRLLERIKAERLAVHPPKPRAPGITRTAKDTV